MQETTFFTQLLGITRPWFISKVDLNKAEKRVDIHPDGHRGVVVDHPGMEATPARAQGTQHIAGDVDEEPECGREAPEHGGRFYRR